MSKKPVSRLMALVLSAALVFTMMPFTVSVKAAGCTHKHDAECGYVEGRYVTDDDPEDSDIEDDDLEDVELENDYVEGVPATSSNMEGHYVEGAPCQHEHDELCGGLTDSGKTPGKSGEESELVVIAEFDELDEAVAWQTHTVNTITEAELDLPATLNGTDADDNAITIKGVTWESYPEFDPAVSMGYVFSAALPEGYELADGVTAPDIWVFILPEDGLKAQVTSADQQVNIDGLTATSTIQAPIQTAIDDAAASGGGIVTVEGTSAINVVSSIRLNIPANVTVQWEANFSNNAGTAYMLILEGAGSFVMAAGRLTNTGSSFAIYVSSSENVSVTVSGGTVSSAGSAISANNAASAVTVTGGEILSTGSGTYAIRAAGDVTLGGDARISSTSGTGVLGATVAISDTASVTAGQFAVTGNEVIMTGGTVSANSGDAIFVRSYGHAVISGGTVSSTGGNAVYLSNGTVYVLGGIITQSSAITPSLGTNYAYYLGDRSDLFGSSYYWGGRYRLDALTYKGPNNTDYTYSNSAYVSGVTASLTNASLMDLTGTTVTVQNATGAHTINADKTVTFSGILNAANVKLTVSGARIGDIDIPTFTTDEFGVNVSSASDSTPPVPGNSGTLTATNVASGGLTLNWTKATDNESAQSALKYYVYQSASNNIDTAENCAANGTLLNTGGAADTASYNVTGLSADTYYFNVVVEDGVGNKAAYTMVSFEPVITTTALANGTAGTFYSQSLAATGGTPITWSLDTGSSLPSGLSLISNGTITGTPTQVGTFTFTVKAANGLGINTKSLSITVTGMINPTVTTTADSGAGSLRQALSDVTSGGTITVNPSLGTITLVSSLTISKNCTIEGNGVTISGNSAYRILSVNSGTVTINRVHFTKGRSTSNPGGAIYNNGSLTLNSCIFSDNSASNGGAIENNYNATNLTVRSCTFYNNNASTYGGAIDNCILSVSIIGCLLWGNTAGSTGAGIYSDYNVNSGGYNVHPNGDSYNFTYITSDKEISAIPFNTSDFTPVASSGAEGVITTRPANYPTIDFFGNAIPATNATAGAVQGDPPTAVTATATVLTSATGSMTITLAPAITGLAAGDVTVKVNGTAKALTTDYTLSVSNDNSVVITFTADAALNNTSVISVEILKIGYAVNNGSPISVTNSIPAAATPLAQVTGIGFYVTGQVVWANLTNETGLTNYSVQLYKNGSMHGSPKTGSAGTGTTGVNFLTEMRDAGVGTYTVTVTAIGNGTTHSNGPESNPSNEQSVQELATPGSLAWSGDNATFDRLAGETEVAHYYITISGGGTVASNTVAKTGSNLSVPVTTPADGDTFTVKAIAVTTGLYLDSAGATSAGYVAPTYVATIDPTSKTFTASTVGYGQQAEQTFTIENTGTGQITGLTASLQSGASFEISTALSDTGVNPGSTVTVGVRPKMGLSASTYTDTLTIMGDNGISLTASLSFTVNAAPTYTTTITIPQVNGNAPANAVSNPAAVTQGTQVNLPIVTANAGFVFKQWTVTAGAVTITNPTSATNAYFTMGTANVTINAEFEAATLTFGNRTLANGIYNTAYSANVTAPTGGSGTYTYTATVPTGLTMNTAGLISGTPNAVITAQTFPVTVTDTITGATANATYTLTIAKANQTLNAANISRVAGGGNVNLSGHATSSAGTGNGGTISYAVTTAGAGASISGTTLSYTTAGTATITATAAGDANYNSATTTFTLTVTLPSLGGTATISGTNKTGQTLTADTSQITGASGNWHYAWFAGTGAAANAADQSTLVIGGADAGKVITCVITSTDASSSVTAQFDSGSTVPYNVAITNVGNVSGDTAVALSASTGRAGNAITLSYGLGNGGGKLTNTLTFMGGTGLTAVMSAGAGTGQTYTVNASDAVNGVITITATFLHTDLLPRTLSFSDAGPVSKAFDSGSFTNAAMPSAGSGTVTYTSSVQSVATINSSGSVTILSAGQTTITAEIVADAAYAWTTASYTLTVTNASQAAPSGIGKTDETGAGANDGTITVVNSSMEYRLSTNTLYTAITGTTVMGLAPGTYYVRYAAKANYNAGADTTVTIAAYNSPTTYTVTFDKNGGDTEANPQTKTVTSPATTVGTLPAPPTKSGYTFTGWNRQANGSGTAFMAVTTVTGDITVYAQWRYNGGGSSGGGSSSSGGSSSPRYNITTAKQHSMPKVATMTYTGTVQDDQLTCTITKDMVQADVNAAGTDPDGIALTFIITNSSIYNSQTISIAGDALDLLRSSGVKYVQVQTGIFRFHFDSAAISSLDSQTTGTVTVSAAPISPLSDAANAVIGNRPVFDFTIHDSAGNTVTSYGNGTVTRGIRYTADSTENTGSLFIVKIVDGTVQWIDRSSYDNGWMIWSGDSNSVYGVGYKAPAPAFTDTTSHWAKDDIDFATSRGLISGTGATAFSPDTAIIRADFLMALGRLSGADVSGYTTGSFTDVPAASPAMPYIQWAVANNIVQGTGDNSFGPDNHITREQMAVIMVNYAEATGHTLPVSRLAVTFADDAQISTYAKEAVKAIQQTGVISGKADNLFDPQGSVTRAEAGTILRRFTKLVIDGNTARGWVRNDIGQWQYITPDGRTVTGWLNTASGIWYWFGDKGIMAAGEWVQIGGRWYYFYDDGQMAANTTIDGYEVGEDGARKE